jgi:hypothetical protein
MLSWSRPSSLRMYKRKFFRSPSAGMEVRIFCHGHTRFSCYTVRSGYNLARACKFNEQRSSVGCGMTSGTDGDSKLWKTLWSVKAPGKMIITLWHFSHDCLPSGHQLQKRHIPACTDCIFCGRHESIEHALLFCQFAREVWEAVRTVHPINL